MEILLLRYNHGRRVTDGSVIIDGERICDTIEVTACMRSVGKQDHHNNFLDIFKKGNGAFNVADDRIIVGTAIYPGCVIKSKAALDLLFEKIREASIRDEEINFRIEEVKI